MSEKSACPSIGELAEVKDISHFVSKQIVRVFPVLYIP
jgi:hypothetical protein